MVSRRLNQRRYGGSEGNPLTDCTCHHGAGMGVEMAEMGLSQQQADSPARYL
jgi:hypothetical protein